MSERVHLRFHELIDSDRPAIAHELLMDITIDLDDSDSEEQDTKRQRTDGAAPTSAAA